VEDGLEAAAHLLWAVARPTSDPDVVRRLAGTDGGGTDLSATIAAARRHRLVPLLWRALLAAGCDRHARPWGDELAAEAHVRRTEALVLFPHALSLAVAPLTAIGLEPILFKGPALSARYPEPGLRPMVDIDLLLAARDRRPAVAALRSAGWRTVDRPGRTHYDTALRHPDVPSLGLEVHHRLDLWYERSNRLRLEALWESRVPLCCMGTDVFGLAIEEELVALAAHAGKPYHCFGQLIWVTDLVVAASASAGGVDWDRVDRLATAWRCRTVLAVALSQAARLGLDAPHHVREPRASSVRRAALAPLLDERWPVTEISAGLRTRLRYALVDRWTRRAVLFITAPAPAPLWRWPGRLAGTSWRAASRTRRLATGAAHNLNSRTGGAP